VGMTVSGKVAKDGATSRTETTTSATWSVQRRSKISRICSGWAPASQTELSHLKTQLVAERTMPAPVVQLLRDCHRRPSRWTPCEQPHALGCHHYQGKPTLDKPLESRPFPTLPGCLSRLRHGLEPLESRSELGHAPTTSICLPGSANNRGKVKQLDAYLVLLRAWHHRFNLHCTRRGQYRVDLMCGCARWEHSRVRWMGRTLQSPRYARGHWRVEYARPGYVAYWRRAGV